MAERDCGEVGTFDSCSIEAQKRVSLVLMVVSQVFGIAIAHNLWPESSRKLLK